jgi:hypothetical protein
MVEARGGVVTRGKHGFAMYPNLSRVPETMQHGKVAVLVGQKTHVKETTTVTMPK